MQLEWLLFFFQDLEEELELDRKRVLEAEGGAKRAEEELAVAKERLLLQEDELQSRAGRLAEVVNLYRTRGCVYFQTRLLESNMAAFSYQ